MGKPREAGTTYVSSLLDPHAQFKPVPPKLAEMECVAPRPGGPNDALQSVAPNMVPSPVWYPPGTIQSCYNITDHIPQAVLYSPRTLL